MNVNGKTVVVTGGGNGIGRELVLLLLKKGARVAAVDLREIALKETRELAGSAQQNLSLHVLDIGNREEVALLSQKVREKHGQVHGLINNAGIIQPFVRIKDLDFDTVEKVMKVNFYGTLYMIKSFLPELYQAPEAHIVNISSMGGFLPVPGQSVYGASKAAVKLMTEGLYAELLETHIRVSVVFPGAIGTNITGNSGVKIPGNMNTESEKARMKVLPPDQAAALIISGMEKNKHMMYIGNDSKFMNWLYRLFPGFATRFIARRMKSLLS